ncbi:major facilitator superfamily domain-containing protein [Syncephalastrum racemosum]|uniref:Major facilitator superfamily domain-containing protein n=1 Tax=Syncephalastrum racemosum TaxID=13706 RepID=A0A1X2HN58_SYNRA|nr:major facilitator superfamily domain-containing protein [Syncephalastrum racemosum]
MQDYYAQNVFTAVPNATLQLSFAGTLWEFFIYLCSPIVQISISKFGYTSTNVFGLLLMTLGCELASFSTEIWHLYMTQGLLFGAGSCFLFITTTGLVPQWFTRRRGLANGVIAAGTGLGGLVLPLLVITPSNNTLGIAWTYRIIGILTFGFNVFTCIVVKPRRNDKLDEKQIKLQTRQQRMFDMEVFKDLNYILWVAASVIGILAFTLPYFFLPCLSNLSWSASNYFAHLETSCSLCNAPWFEQYRCVSSDRCPFCIQFCWASFRGLLDYMDICLHLRCTHRVQCGFRHNGRIILFAVRTYYGTDHRIREVPYGSNYASVCKYFRRVWSIYRKRCR